MTFCFRLSRSTKSQPDKEFMLSINMYTLILLWFVIASQILCAENSREKSLRIGLDWLLRQQDKTTGQFSGDLPYVVTSLSCLAIMSQSLQNPTTESSQRGLKNGILYLIREGEKNKGWYGTATKGPMYAQAICVLTLALAQDHVLQEQEQKRCALVLRQSLATILQAQVSSGEFAGGWRYRPDGKDADICVGYWQLLAIRTAIDAGMEVPSEVFASAKSFIQSCFNEEMQCFSYQGKKLEDPSSMASAGLVSWRLMGRGLNMEDQKMVKGNVDRLLASKRNFGSHFYTSMHYKLAALEMIDDPLAAAMKDELQQVLCQRQMKDGSFSPDPDVAGRVFSTAFALFSLGLQDAALPMLPSFLTGWPWTERSENATKTRVVR